MAKPLVGYILKSGCRIEPFGDRVSESLIANRRLADIQAEAIRSCGAIPRYVDSPPEMAPGPAIILPDRVYVTEKVLKDFAGAVGGEPAMLGLERCVSVDYNLPIQDVISDDKNVYYSCFIVPDAGKFRDAGDNAALEARLVAASKKTVVKMREMIATMRLPTLARKSHVMRFPVTSSMAAHVVHWVTLLRLNCLQWGVRWMENMRHNPFDTVGMTLKAFAKARSVNPYRLMSEMNVIGEGAIIHDTAYVEASFIGRGATIGAGATVRNSFVGDGAVIADQSYLMNANIGDGAFVTDDLSLIWCTVYPGASVSGVKTQMTLVGRDSYVGMWCSFLDAKFIGEIMVDHRGSLVSAGTSFLGSCVGHNCVLAGKVLVMPGRAIPNGTVMVTRPDECIMEIEPDLPRGVPLIRDNGRLVPLKR